MTVTELSRLAGCSVATVSRVLNNSGSVSPEMRETIHRALRETQYLSQRGPRRGRKPRRPTAGATNGTATVEIIHHRHSPVEKVSLDGGHLKVGPLSDFPTTPRGWSASCGLGQSFYRQVLDGLVHELSAWGYRAQVRLNTDLLAPDFLADVNNPERSGIILMGEYSPDLGRFVEQCLHPMVLIDLIHAGAPDVVTIDNVAGISAAVEHLFELGHRDIGYVGRNDDVVAFGERFNAYQLKMLQAGLRIRPEWVYQGANHIEPTARGVRQILEQPSRPTALVCSNDVYALGVVRAAASLGVSIPDQLSVVGFDDLEFSVLVTPPLTSVHVPLQDMGRQGVRELMIQMQAGLEPKRRGCHVRLLPDLVVRQSTARRR